LHEGTVWLTQKQLAELYQVTVAAISQHIRNIFDENELTPEATVKQFLTVRTEGNRKISRTVDHYSLPVVIAVGYRVRSLRGTQFRQWATTRLEEYVIKGFTLDDQRLKMGRARQDRGGGDRGARRRVEAEHGSHVVVRLATTARRRRDCEELSRCR
jgi:hypothetical protein